MVGKKDGFSKRSKQKSPHFIKQETFQFILVDLKRFKVKLSPSKKCVICFIESSSEMIKNPFYFILKAFFVLKIFKLLSQRFGQVRKTDRLER